MNDKEKIEAIKKVYEDYESGKQLTWPDESSVHNLNSYEQIRKIAFSD